MLNDVDRRYAKGSTLDNIKLEYLEDVLTKIVEKIFEQKERQLSEQSPLLTIEEVAKKFKVSKATIHNWMKRGCIKGDKVGKNRYFTEQEVQSALKSYGFLR